MRKVILDFKPIRTREDVHKYLAMKFDLPDYYGANLDALYECLSEIREDTCVGFFELDPGDGLPISVYLKRLKCVLRDVEEDNPHFAVIFGDMEENFTLKEAQREAELP